MNKGLFLLILLGWSSATVAARCGPMFNPVTDVSWQCIFPIRIGGLVQVGGGDLPDAEPINNPLCVCNQGAVPKVGLNVSFYEPARLIDTVVDPYCFMATGTQLANPNPGRLGGALHRDYDSGISRAFAQMHYYIFPVWAVLDLFTDMPCVEQKGFDIAFMTEVMPHWNNEILAFLLNPEAALFANPAAQLACSADAVGALHGKPVDPLYWCMGSWGSAYPLAGSITSSDYVEANAGLAAKGIYSLARLGLLLDPAESPCGSVKTPIWRKSHYRLQQAKPVRDHSCRPIGQSGMLWTQGKNKPLNGDNFSWMMFRKVRCCV